MVSHICTHLKLKQRIVVAHHVFDGIVGQSDFTCVKEGQRAVQFDGGGLKAGPGDAVGERHLRERLASRVANEHHRMFTHRIEARLQFVVAR